MSNKKYSRRTIVTYSTKENVIDTFNRINELLKEDDCEVRFLELDNICRISFDYPKELKDKVIEVTMRETAKLKESYTTHLFYPIEELGLAV